MSSNKLKGKIIEKGMNNEQMASVLGCDRATFYRKLNHFEKFTIGEIMKMRDALSLTDQECVYVFLN